jgi:Ca2+-binding EF-hand superfamily protein
VRKAFLDVDTDYDGFITPEDIAKFYGAQVDFKDIQTMMKNRDSSKQGKIDFKDFCKWMGTAIEPCEGFYFRHDSVKNPQYENNVRKQIESNAKSV